MIAVTVLMPIYNAERFLHDSIGSLLAQTCDRWKLICIDDGSTDNSRLIVEEYCKRDCRIKLICQENAGPAVARARAIEIAETEYVAILDSDDAYAPDYVEKMLARAEETDADSIVPDVKFLHHGIVVGPNRFSQYQLSSNLILLDREQAFQLTLPWKLHGWQMIKTVFAKKYYTIQQVSYSKFNSDEYVTRLLYLKSEKVALCSAIYKHTINEKSITRKPSLKVMDYLVTNMKLLSLARSEHLNVDLISDIYNDFYVTYKDLRQNRIPLMDEPDKKVGKVKLNQAYMEFKRHFQYANLRNKSFRTKLKFFLFITFCFCK